MNKQKIGIITSGGDAPGMNAYLYFFLKQAMLYNVEYVLFEDAFLGLVEDRKTTLDERFFETLLYQSGSIIKTKRFPEFKQMENVFKAKTVLLKNEIDLLIVIGGNGSLNGAKALTKVGVKTIFIPATIDNDVPNCEYSLGYDSALNSINEECQKLIASTTSHGNILLVELMGRGKNHLIYPSAINIGANFIVSRNQRPTIFSLIEVINTLKENGRKQITIVIPETTFKSIKKVAKKIKKQTKYDIKTSILGHTQRGANPTNFDKNLAYNLVQEAFSCINNNIYNVGLIIYNNKINCFSFNEIKKIKTREKNLEQEILNYNQKQLKIKW
ncbi:6-phosphofructokinase [[Mycoplasma] anseris]|uniref:6-phosphofructokinase n=1 Tax=[Mycoplasma] anseris TaxID=92400 RepID=A0A2Z4NDB1_9BACT|nr:6-phosphofructokinase [[Mycoplasma] anseris]AWX69385.1 ATP-dependent 6-phosphofructokinase [[Mycoplasma] anseris]